MPVLTPARAFRRASPLAPARRAARRAMLLALAAYTLGFAAAALAHAWPFLRDGRYFIYGADAYNQHFPAFCYALGYWKQTLAGLAQGQLMPQLYSFSLGLGGDILATLHYYGLANPFYLLALPVPEAKLPLAFSLLVLLQLYLGGLSFYGFCRKLGVPRAGAVVGAWVYLFTGFYALAVEHPIMAHAVFYLPLLLLGCEKVLRRESPLPLALAVFGMALTGFYFLFFCSAALVFYVLLRVWAMGRRPWWRAALGGALRSLAAYLAGLCMACPIFLPGVLGYLGSDRTGSGRLPALFGGLDALRGWWLGLADPASFWAIGAFGLLAAALCLAAPRTRRRPALLAGFGIAAMFIVSPLAQSALVGFGETADTRFWFVLQFLAAFAAARCWPAGAVAEAAPAPTAATTAPAETTPAAAESALAASEPLPAPAAPAETTPAPLTRPQLLAGAALAALAALLCAVYGGRAQWVWLGFLLIDLLLLAAVSLPRLWAALSPKAARGLRRGCCAALALLVLAQPALALHADAARRAPTYRNERFARLMPPITAATLPEGEYRVDAGDVALHRWWAPANAALVGGYKGLSAYYSILSAPYADAMLHDWALAPAQQGSFSFQSLDGCMALDTLASVRYTFVRPGEEGYVPYGFAYVGETPQAPVYTFVPDGGATLLRYENLHTLPLGYAYPAALSAGQVAALNGLQKQAAMLSAVALADGEVPNGFAAEPAVEGVYPLAARQTLDGLVWAAETGTAGAAELGTADADAAAPAGAGASAEAAAESAPLALAEGREAGSLTLSFTLAEPAEVHLRLSGLALPAGGPGLAFALDGGLEKPVYPFALDPEECWVNLGYAGAGPHTARLLLSGSGAARLGGIEAWAYATAAYDAAADALGETVLQNVVVGQNSVAGLLQTDSDCILGLAIPWSSGWRATIDGARAVPRRANSMFMALEVPAGEHVIGLYYITPGLKAGLMLCALGVLALAAQLWLYHKGKKGARGGG